MKKIWLFVHVFVGENNYKRWKLPKEIISYKYLFRLLYIIYILYHIISYYYKNYCCCCCCCRRRNYVRQGGNPRAAIVKLINYNCQPWIEHSVYVPHRWTVYDITVRFRYNRSGPFWHDSVLCSTRSRLFVWYDRCMVLFLDSVHRGFPRYYFSFYC